MSNLNNTYLLIAMSEDYDITNISSATSFGNKKVLGKDVPYPEYQVIEISEALNKIQGGLSFGMSISSSLVKTRDLLQNANFLKSAQKLSPQLIALTIKYRALLNGSQQRILNASQSGEPMTVNTVTESVGKNILIFIIFGIEVSPDKDAIFSDFATHVRDLFTKKYLKVEIAGESDDLLYKTAIAMSKHYAELYEYPGGQLR